MTAKLQSQNEGVLTGAALRHSGRDRVHSPCRPRVLHRVIPVVSPVCEPALKRGSDSFPLLFYGDLA